jgi:hypothetical protein
MILILGKDQFEIYVGFYKKYWAICPVFQN